MLKSIINLIFHVKFDALMKFLVEGYFVDLPDFAFAATEWSRIIFHLVDARIGSTGEDVKIMHKMGKSSEQVTAKSCQIRDHSF